MKFCSLMVIGLASSSIAFAQYGANTRRAEIRGQGFGPGQCYVELEVDHVVEIEIRGDDGLIRTPEGRPGEWHRFECTRRLPRNPVNFRFRSVRGRGRQRLLRPPGNGEPAVVRIEDPQTGAGEYAFEIAWDGGQGAWGPGAPPPGPPPGAWMGARGSTFAFHGDGRGRFLRGDHEMRVHDVNVRLERDGDVFLDFEAEGFRRLQFRGRVERYSPDSVVAQLTSTGSDRETRGGATIFLDRTGQVQRIDMGGRIEGRDFRLNWNAR